MKKKNKIILLVIILLVIIISIFALIFLNRNNNKSLTEEEKNNENISTYSCIGETVELDNENISTIYEYRTINDKIISVNSIVTFKYIDNIKYQESVAKAEQGTKDEKSINYECLLKTNESELSYTLSCPSELNLIINDVKDEDIINYINYYNQNLNGCNKIN